MTWIQIIVLIAAGIGILAIIGGGIGMFCSGSDYIPQSPDEEYRMLTDHYGLTPKEAEEVMRHG